MVLMRTLCLGLIFQTPLSNAQDLLPLAPTITTQSCRLREGDQVPDIRARVQWPVWQEPDGTLAQHYELEVAMQHSKNRSWTSWFPMLDHPSRGSEEKSRYQITEVQSRVNEGHVITEGTFRLTFLTAGARGRQGRANAVTTTSALNYDASTDDVQSALERLDGLTSVRVHRFGPDAGQGYTWRLTYTTEGETGLLQFHSETLNRSWRAGAGDQVVIRTVRPGQSFVAPCFESSVVCEEQVLGLTPGTSLRFRYRAMRVLHDYSSEPRSDWSITSSVYHTCVFPLPPAPIEVGLSSRTSRGLSIQWKIPTESLTENPGLNQPQDFETTFEMQQQCNDALDWTTVHLGIPDSRGLTLRSSGQLAPDSGCRFRLRGKNAAGFGPYSVVSELFRTLPDVPSPPRDLILSGQVKQATLVAQWQVPEKNGGSPILHYELQYRPSLSEQWIPLPHNPLPALQQRQELSQLKVFTSYVVRLRAVNAVGPSDFTESKPTRTSGATVRPLAESATSQAHRQAQAQNTEMVAATSHFPAATSDLNYFPGTGQGGQGPSTSPNGQPGLVILARVTVTGARLPVIRVFESQNVTLSGPSDYQVDELLYVEILAWGGGGGAGPEGNTGGGGGFIRAPMALSIGPEGETLEIRIGGGGQGYIHGGQGGKHGGGAGGAGEFGGAGGGGATSIWLDSKMLVVAPGGAGAGASTECCSHGGPGGGGHGSVAILAQDSHHENLDTGFSPGANYSELAGVGTGANGTFTPGQAGHRGSYQVFNSINQKLATNGQRLAGGHGGDGYRAGGGGGGGFYGGGGGGGGISGAGGGGGSGFIDYTRVFIFPSQISSPPSAPSSLSLSSLTPTQVTLHWSAAQELTKTLVTGYIVEQSQGLASEDFKVLSVVNPAARELDIQNLVPESITRLRVRALTRNQPGAYSQALVVVTPSEPVNRWTEVHWRQGQERGKAAGGRFVDPPTPEFVSPFPSARRGHSMVHIQGFLYLFGGRQVGYECERGVSSTCVTNRGVSSELWRFDPRTSVWVQWKAIVGSPWPCARELHSAFVLSDRLLVFGGHNGGPTVRGSLLNDLWEMNPGHVSPLCTTETETPIALPRRKFLLMNSTASVDSSQCIRNLTLSITLEHMCVQNLELMLLGPGPSNFPHRQQRFYGVSNDTVYYHEQDESSWEAESRKTPLNPTLRGFPVLLFQYNSGSSPECWTGRRTFVFHSKVGPAEEELFRHLDTDVIKADASDIHVQEEDSFRGSFRPLESLSVFHNLPAAGQWQLQLYDKSSTPGSEVNQLLSWKLDFSLASCTADLQWQHVETTGAMIPSPRYQSTSIVVDNAMFLLGGSNEVGQVLHSELYRLDRNPTLGKYSWTQLAPLATVNRRNRVGRSMVLTPLEFLSVAGLSLDVSDQESLDVFHKTFLRPTWKPVDVEVSGTRNTSRGPGPRYHSSFVYVPGSRSMILYGGDDSTTMLGDMWQLQVRALEPGQEQEGDHRADFCHWRTASSVYQLQWQQRCLAKSPPAEPPCAVTQILEQAWCGENYQSIGHL